MFKLYKNLKPKDIIGVILIIGLTFLQVYLTMTMVDYIEDIIRSIMYVNYHNNPSLLGDSINQMLLQFGNNNIEDGWKYILNNIETIEGLGLDTSTINTLKSIAKAQTSDIWYYGGMMILIAFGIMVVQAIISLLASIVAANLSTTIREKVYKKVESFSQAEINMFETSSLITRTGNDIQNVQMANLLTMRMIFAAPITAVWAIIKIQASSSTLTLSTAVAIVLLLIGIITIMLIALPKFKSMQKLTDKLNEATRENLTGMRVVRAFNGEDYQEKRFEKANNDLTKAQIFTGRATACFSPLMTIISNGVTLAIYIIGANLINKGEIEYATVTSFMTLASQIIMSFVMLLMLFIMWPRALVSAKRINEVLDTDTSIKDPINPKEAKEVGTIEFKNVSFKYEGAADNILSNLNFKVNKGETVAFIGATGVGKSTLVNLIPRLYDTTEGEVLVDGVSVKDYLKKDLRDKIGYVPQKGFLFKGTIKDNIKLSNKEMTDSKVQEVCNVACASDFINSTDLKYDTFIAQGGKNVSGGQRQRLCIARAIARRPEIYIFDDSFSALDYKTDQMVRKNLNEYAKDATKIIVAQRIGTILDADKIVVLSDGKIDAIGTHEELLKESEVYKEIALSQLSKEELGL